MLIYSERDSDQYRVTESDYFIGSAQKIEQAVEIARGFLRSSGRKNMKLEASYGYRFGLRATSFRIQEIEDGYVVTKTGETKTVKRENLEKAWKYCIEESRRPFKATIVFLK